MSDVEVQEMLALFPVLLCTGYTDSSKKIYTEQKENCLASHKSFDNLQM